MVLKRHRFVSRRTLSRMFQEAADAWKRQDYSLTIGTLERASRLDPANASLLFDLGRAHGLRYDYAEAESCFEKAVRLTAKPQESLVEAGRRCQDFGCEAMAARYFERAANLPTASPTALVALAELYERHSHLDDAAELVERALSSQPDHPAAGLARARLSRLRGAFEAAESMLRTLLARSIREPATRARAWYELGGVLDRQGRYDEAMDAILEAKRILRPASAGPLAILEGIQARLAEMEATMTSDVFDRWFEARDRLQPSRRLAVLCGHPRSGTTLLEQVLDGHPGILSAEETHVLHDEAYLPLSRGFSPDTSVLEMLDAAPVGALQRSRQDYFRFIERMVGESIGDKLLVDKNPALTVLIPAVARLFPEASFLVARRDPRDVCLSCFMQPLPLNPVSSAYLSLESTATQYASVMGFWEKMRSRLRNPFLEVRYEDLVSYLESESRRVLAFLGVEWDERVLRFHDRARSKLLRSPSYGDVTRPVFGHAVGRWRHYEKFFGPWSAKLDPFLDAHGYR